MRSHPRPVRYLLAALVLAVSGCSTSGDDAATTTLRAELDAAQEQQRQLRERVADLEEALAPDDRPTEDPLSGLEERLDGLEAAVEELTSGLRAEAEARGAAVAGFDEDVAALDNRLAELQAGVAELRGAVQELTDELASLETQFKAHRDDDSRHR